MDFIVELKGYDDWKNVVGTTDKNIDKGKPLKRVGRKARV
jgi:hypothetical protein